MSSITPHLRLIEAIASHFDHVLGSDDAVTYAVHDRDVRVSSPDYLLTFTNWPDGPADLSIDDNIGGYEYAVAYEVAEAIALADRDLNGAILAALRQGDRDATAELTANLEAVGARF